jgi:hypothetical protein
MKWLLGVLVAVGLPVLVADLNDVDVCHWLARQLIRRAAQRLPRRDHLRWEEEWLRHSNDVPGRLLPLARALRIFIRAGSWGRILRGSPSPSEMLRARVRAAWQRLRSRPKAPSEEAELEPVAVKVELPAIATVEAKLVMPTFRSGGDYGFKLSWQWASKPVPLDRKFEDYLARWQQDTDECLARCQQETDECLGQQRQKNRECLAHWDQLRSGMISTNPRLWSY